MLILSRSLVTDSKLISSIIEPCESHSLGFFVYCINIIGFGILQTNEDSVNVFLQLTMSILAVNFSI